MTCPECHRDNPPGNRFCGSCGTKLPAAEVKVDPNAPSVTWLKSMEERELGGATEAERVTRQREMAERAERAALRERELAIRAEAERSAIREREAQRAATTAEKREESNNRTRPVGAPSFLGLNENYDQAPEQDTVEYEGGDIYGGGRSYSRALLLLVVLMVVGGLVFLQWRYSNGLKASPPVEKPSATQPSEAGSENPEAKQEDALAQKNEAESANPESDAAANAQDEAKSAANSDEAKKSPSDARQSANDKAKKPAEKSPGADQQEGAAGETEESASEETAQQSKATAKPSPRTRAQQQEQVPDVSDEPVRLAESYLLGRGLPQSCPQAVTILREAANRGNYKAQIKLGALYATGNCVSQDRVQAYRFFTRALQGKPGNTWVEQNRSMLWAHMNDQERRLAMEHRF